MNIASLCHREVVAIEDLMAAIHEELAHLAQALRNGIEREKSERKPATKPAGPRPLFPSFGTGSAAYPTPEDTAR
jgi:hypothetical protein